MGLLRFYSATIRLLYLLLRLERVRLGLFSRALVILSTLILFIPLAYPQAINIHNGRAYMPISEVSPAGVQRIRYLNGGFDAIYHPAKDLSRIRSAASGATAVARVPAVVSRTVPAARVAGGVLSKARYLKAGGLPGLVITTVAPIVIEKLLADNGYFYDLDQKDFVDGNEYVIQLMHRGSDDKWHVIASRGLSKEAVAMGEERYAKLYIDELCRNTWNKVKGNREFEYWTSRKYDYSHVDRYSRGCVIAKDGDERQVIGYRVVGNANRPITEQQFQEIIQPYLEKDPEAWVKAADLPESAWGAPKVLITQETIVNSEPYTDSRDGKAKQSQFRLWPCGGETCATETIKDRPDLKPNSPEAPVATPGGDVGDKTGDKDKTDNQQPPPFDLCKEHPDILACQGMGDVKGNEFDDIKIPRHVNQETWKPDSFLPDNGVCPAPKTFHVLGKQFSVSYEPLCVLMEKVRFIVLIAFILMSAYVAFGGLRKG